MLLSRFNLKYNQLTNNIANVEILENYMDMIKYITCRFRYTNVLKYIKPHIITIKKPLGISQDNFLDRMMQVQQYLQLLHQYFNSITKLNDIEFKDAYVQH